MSIKNLVEHEMKQVIEHFVQELKNIRTGRANPAMLDNVSIEVYGAQMRLRDVASVSTPEPRQLVITPFDPKTTASIGKSIEKANLGLMPIVDANMIRINVPSMDQSVRKEMIKLLHKKREDAKVSVRHVRGKHNKSLKANDGIADDEVKRGEKQIQELTDQYCKKIDELAQEKENDISTI